ncbi:MAG TPA: hypothetical protein PKW90_16510, partial [Myxococcota bacterium]|nr:hypothetical protein [Myxococcota bacterium]
MTTLHPHLHALFMLQPRIRAALRQRWSDSCPGRLDDAMGNLWLDMVTHQDRYLSVPAEGRLAYCIRVAHYS